ncbi:hypothetical protein Tdes44962_MAKER07419 [Teratosphaeria destructans]|uniref:Uncharacterized protein n=1 Tax=Teratosphaeria destructans TaxID=418781 RepID=A0A9W7W5T1_9PEZI|nr:hypothetical protein Tdes44962_MAKER07419 [Teratosphaeria destructans]
MPRTHGLERRELFGLQHVKHRQIRGSIEAGEDFGTCMSGKPTGANITTCEDAATESKHQCGHQVPKLDAQWTTSSEDMGDKQAAMNYNISTIVMGPPAMSTNNTSANNMSTSAMSTSAMSTSAMSIPAENIHRRDPRGPNLLRKHE